MQVPVNRFKRALAERRLQLGLWSQLCSAMAAEALGRSGFDWLLIDTEHAPNEVPAVMAQLQALAPFEATSPIVRVAWNDMVLIKRLLDIGAQTLLVPFVQNEAEARRAVGFTRYPPAGVRGVATNHRANQYSRIGDYLHAAGNEICVLVQVESRAALDAIEAIAGVEGVDGIFIGPNDLAASLGHLGNPAHPEVQAAIDRAFAQASAKGKPMGILAPVEADARRYIAMGFAFVAVGSDLALLVRNADALAAKYRGAGRD
jgi:4-hydroxy-2-oxoheptanedioate aldolase